MKSPWKVIEILKLTNWQWHHGGVQSELIIPINSIINRRENPHFIKKKKHQMVLLLKIIYFHDWTGNESWSLSAKQYKQYNWKEIKLI